MRVVIAGGTGFLGHALSQHLTSQRHEVVILSRGAETVPGARVVAWKPNGSTGPWAAEIEAADAVVNLSGAGIADKRWTEERKKLLLESRTLSTRSLAEAIRAANRKPSVFVQASGAGFYGAHEDGRQTFDERSPAGNDFLGQLCVQWESSALPIATAGVRLVTIRNGIVLARHGGALAKMLPPFHFLAGGPIASGRQYTSWITLDDWIAMVMWAITNEGVSGAINGVAPNPVDSKTFARAIGRAVHRPSWAPVPAFVLRLMFGEMAQNMLILGQRVVPKRAQELGFKFTHPEVQEALQSVLT